MALREQIVQSVAWAALRRNDESTALYGDTDDGSRLQLQKLQ
jgi:hypothetical protein